MRSTGLCVFLPILLLACGQNIQDQPIHDMPSDQGPTSEIQDDGTGDLPGYTVLVERPELTFPFLEMSDDSDEMIMPSEAQRIVWEAYPDLNFGEDIMSGTEFVGDTWIQGYMFSAQDGFDVIEVIVDGYTGEIVKEVLLEDFAAPSASSCTISSISSGTKYSQRDSRWSGDLLGYSSTDTIYDYGCLMTSYAMIYHNTWSTSTNPSQLNSSAQSAGCFDPGSSILYHGCTLNSRGGPHWFSFIGMSSVASTLCAGYPVVVKVTSSGGGYHYMLAYRYTGGSTSSTSSYYVVDPWYGTTKSLSGYTTKDWIKVY